MPWRTSLSPEPDARHELLEQVGRISWHHRIDLGHGVVTPGGDTTEKKLERLGLPDSLEGRTVLDIGAWDGFFSFEAERRGADRVLATDSFIWQGGSAEHSKAGFDLAHRVLGSTVEHRTIDVMDLTPQVVGTFDLVLFLGVLYHLRHPLLALERVYSVTGDQLILETHVERLPVRRPAMVLYPNDELDGDATNWWGPNRQGIVALLRTAGFRDVRVVGRWRAGRTIRDRLTHERVVLHARR
jgi:tRNA (mo5U34)-methyltransferase